MFAAVSTMPQKEAARTANVCGGAPQFVRLRCKDLRIFRQLGQPAGQLFDLLNKGLENFVHELLRVVNCQ
jgi:hypothetical protein